LPVVVPDQQVHASGTGHRAEHLDHPGVQPLTCANHLWEFDALTGNGTNPGNCRLTAFDIRVRDGQIEILAPGPEL
jgi:nitrite reductase/ring-hydroxylating ferredoxin subunit